MDDALATLSRFERFAFRTMRWLQTWPPATFWQRFVLIPFVALFVSRRLTTLGLERVPRTPDARILLVANHRTFFDLFVLGFSLWRRAGLKQRLNFPVRANFFYENPAGLLICMFLSGGTMFPPFFRSAEKKSFNKLSLGVLIDLLRQPGQLVGFHPEGKRNKSDDPYTLLPAQPGAGELALKARPVVVPAFITGMSNSVWKELFSSRRVIAIFGEPIELPEIEGETRLAHHKRLADSFNERILALADEERAARAAAK
ncbi:MAG TPA: lysophospholipid acyltransferase family protein [Myxococcales bacterium]|nr:lysophospholipid acyltransferase family protein [Myxococcales bacterium]